jgi:geranylgeranyl diphosphate synthase type II
LTSQLDEALPELRREVDRSLDEALPPEDAWPPVIHQAVRYSLFAGGKRLRPLLVLAAAEAVGGDREQALPLACAVELIHTYSLIHDDLPAMDDDDLRRGKPTCHKVYGEANAILAGDALLTRAFHLLGETAEELGPDRLRRRLRVIALLGEACGMAGLIGGQVVDLEAAGVDDVTPEALERIHRAKTGALLSACVEGGGVLGGADDEQLAALGRYGRAVGLAFQVVDDILDATGSAAQLGKTPGKDAAAGKATYVRLHGLDGARAKAEQLLADALGALSALGEEAELLRHLARRVVERHR